MVGAHILRSDKLLMDSQTGHNISFKSFAEQMLESAPAKSIEAFALISILDIMRKEACDDIDENTIKLWLALMIVSGRKVSTCKRYFGKLHTVYAEYAGADRPDPFLSVSPVFSTLHEANLEESKANLDLVKQLTDKTDKSPDWQTINIFFYLLYNPATSISDVVDLTFSEAPRFCPQVEEIINSADSSHGRKYVFALKQGKSRPNEIEKSLTNKLQSLMTSVGMRFANGFSRGSITSIWIAAALQCSIDIKDIRSCLSTIPQDYSVLSLIEKTELTETAKTSIICKVADTINNNTARWFVMKLRRGVEVDEIKDRIANKLPGMLNSTLFFYPTHAEIHKEGRKHIVEEIPYLPNILFFKTRSNRVRRLFAEIGDMAWCFKSSAAPDSDYAIISNKQMSNFQQCIGRFTADIKLELVDTEQTFEKGRRVKVVGGIMAGYEGEILDVEGEPGKRVFSLSITGNKEARWTVHVDDVFIRPLD